MRISDWSSDVCSSDLFARCERNLRRSFVVKSRTKPPAPTAAHPNNSPCSSRAAYRLSSCPNPTRARRPFPSRRSEEHTSELQSLMRISYAVFCLKKKRKKHNIHSINHTIQSQLT